MPIPKQVANKVLSNLDLAASRIEELAKNGKLDPRLASNLVRDIDTFADKFEVSAYGADSLKRRQAAVLHGDADERHYMNTFENTVKPLKTDGDEQYMHTTGHGARWAEDVPSFDADRSSVVANRPEYNVRGQSDVSNGGKTARQPSWSGAGRKSTASAKTWAD